MACYGIYHYILGTNFCFLRMKQLTVTRGKLDKPESDNLFFAIANRITLKCCMYTVHHITLKLLFEILIEHVEKVCLLVRYLKYMQNIHKVEMKLAINSDHVAVFSVYVYWKKQGRDMKWPHQVFFVPAVHLGVCHGRGQFGFHSCLIMKFVIIWDLLEPLDAM